MTKWEYMTIQTRDYQRDILPKLNEMGEEGWELVTILTFGKPEFIPDVYYTCFFKRPVEEEAQAADGICLTYPLAERVGA